MSRLPVGRDKSFANVVRGCLGGALTHNEWGPSVGVVVLGMFLQL